MFVAKSGTILDIHIQYNVYFVGTNDIILVI